MLDPDASRASGMRGPEPSPWRRARRREPTSDALVRQGCRASSCPPRAHWPPWRRSHIWRTQSSTGAFQGSLLLGVFLTSFLGFSPIDLAIASASLLSRQRRAASAHAASFLATCAY